MLSSISFGKIIKVNAPVDTAQKIILMSHSNTDAGKKLNFILHENKQSRAHAYSFPDSRNESYIFTEEEGQKYWKSHCEAWDRIEHSHQDYKSGRPGYKSVQAAWKKHSENVADIIKSYKGKILEINADSLENKNKLNIVL